MGVERLRQVHSTPFLPSTLRHVREYPSEKARIGSSDRREIMRQHDITDTIGKPTGGLLGGWISRTDLALQLGVSEDTLRRWDALRSGPPCIRAGRKVFYRRAGVLEWLEEQEALAPRRKRQGGRR
jgi:hypothetical protein